jgi:hypothetical protein
MKTLLLALTIVALALPSCVLACSPAYPDESMARESKGLFVGTAISSRWSDERPNLKVRVKVTEVLRGRASGEIFAISPCALPIKNGERVVVVQYKDGQYDYKQVVYTAEMAEKVLRAGLRAGH